MWQRTNGFQRAFEMRHIPFDPNKQIIDLRHIAPLVDPSGSLLTQLLERRACVDFGASKMLPYLIEHGYFDNVTAVACVCDATAISLIKALQQYGYSVPGDISVTGFDDIVLASMMSPSLTTVHLNFKAIAQSAFKILLHAASNNMPLPIRVLSKVTICERESVHPINGKGNTL